MAATTYTSGEQKRAEPPESRPGRFQQRGDHYTQFTFNKSCFLAYLRREEPLLTAAAALGEVLNASRESMASCLKSSLSVSGAEAAVCRRDKRWREEISMTLMSSDIEQLVMKHPPPPNANGPGSERDRQPCVLRVWVCWRGAAIFACL